MIGGSSPMTSIWWDSLKSSINLSDKNIDWFTRANWFARYTMNTLCGRWKTKQSSILYTSSQYSTQNLWLWYHKSVLSHIFRTQFRLWWMKPISSHHHQQCINWLRQYTIAITSRLSVQVWRMAAHFAQVFVVIVIIVLINSCYAQVTFCNYIFGI